jgi:hypothetical protein
MFWFGHAVGTQTWLSVLRKSITFALSCWRILLTVPLETPLYRTTSLWGVPLRMSWRTSVLFASSMLRDGVALGEIDTKAAQPVDHPWLQTQGEPVLLAVGRLVAKKDYASSLSEGPCPRSAHCEQPCRAGRGYSVARNQKARILGTDPLAVRSHRNNVCSEGSFAEASHNQCLITTMNGRPCSRTTSAINFGSGWWIGVARGAVQCVK